MKLIQPEFTEINNRYKEKLRKSDSEGGKRVMEERSTLLRKYNINMGAAGLNFLQVPVYICWFLGLRNLLYSPEKFAFVDSSQFLWAPSLFVPDPYFLLPAISAFITFLTIRKTMQRAPITAETPMIFKKLRIYAPYLPFPGAFFLATFPAGINLYFLSIALANYASTVILASPAYLKAIGLPKAYPGTILYNDLMSKSHLTEIKKAVIVDAPVPPAMDSQQTSQTSTAQAPVQSTQTVRVFTNKPKSKKK